MANDYNISVSSLVGAEDTVRRRRHSPHSRDAADDRPKQANSEKKIDALVADLEAGSDEVV